MTLRRPVGSIRAMTARTRKDAGSNAGTDALEPAGDSDESQESGSFESSLERLEAIVDRLWPAAARRNSSRPSGASKYWSRRGGIG